MNSVPVICLHWLHQSMEQGRLAPVKDLAPALMEVRMVYEIRTFFGTFWHFEKAMAAEAVGSRQLEDMLRTRDITEVLRS